MKEPLITMLTIYKPLELGVDWMDYKICRTSDLTFHHIIEARNGGRRVLENGAILVRKSHEYLNYLDVYYPIIYRDLNYLFKELNSTMLPPTKDYYDELHHVLRKVKK